jgi:sucrose-6-phosphate hydrolase SacC (GH32 family)
MKWILHDGATRYYIGHFDGTDFSAESEIIERFNYGSYAYQTWNDIPETDGRRLQVSWLNGPDWPGMPFNQQMTFPCELQLKTFPEGMRVCRTPAKEIKNIYGNKYNWHDIIIDPSNNLLTGIEGMLFDIDAKFDPHEASIFGFKIRDMYMVSYDVDEEAVRIESPGESRKIKMKLIENTISIRVLVDRSSVEVYIDEGRLAFADYFFPIAASQSLELFAEGGSARLVSMDVYELDPAVRKIWTY